MEKFVPIHQHLMIRANPTKTFTDPDKGKEMLREIVSRIGMVPVTEPQCVFVDFPGNEGLTGSINLATSHIAFHMWDNDLKLQLDVYSCKTFDSKVVLEVIKKYYQDLTSYEFLTIDRETFTVLSYEEFPN